MFKPAAGALLLAALLIPSSASTAGTGAGDSVSEVKARVRSMQDDLRKVERLTQEVVKESREVENAADRIRGPNDSADIRIVETQMDALKRDVREAREAAQRVTKLANAVRETAAGVVENQADRKGPAARPRKRD